MILKTTTTLFDIIKSELINDGYNEFYRDGQIVFYEDDVSIMNKILSFDNDVMNIINRYILRNVALENETHDKDFKMMIVSRFINRQIQTQTIDEFRFKAMSYFKTQEQFLNRYYRDLDKYLNKLTLSDRESQSETIGTDTNQDTETRENNSTSTGNQRDVFSDLPQNEINLDLDDSTLDYASENRINKNNNISNDETTSTRIGNSDNNVNVESSENSESQTYDYDILMKIRNDLVTVINGFDKHLFLQVW